MHGARIVVYFINEAPNLASVAWLSLVMGEVQLLLDQEQKPSDVIKVGEEADIVNARHGSKLININFISNEVYERIVPPSSRDRIL